MGVILKNPNAGSPVFDAQTRADLQMLYDHRDELDESQRERVVADAKAAGIVPHPKQGFDLQVSPIRRAVEDIAKPLAESAASFTKENALPIAGQLGAGAVATRFGLPQDVAQGVGAGVGQYANYKLGLVKPPADSMTGLPPDVEGALSVGAATYGGNKLMNVVTTNLPGTQAGYQTIGKARVRGMEAKLRQPTRSPADELYKKIEQGENPSINMTPFEQSMQDVVKEHGSLSRNQRIAPSPRTGDILKETGVLKRVLEYQRNLRYGKGSWTLSQLRGEIKALNEDIRVAERGAGGSVSLGSLKQLRNGMMRSLEQAGEKSTEIKAANKLYAKELAQDELADILRSKGVSYVEAPDFLVPKVNPAQLRNALEKLPEDSLIRKHLKSELPEIRRFLDELAKYPDYEATLSTKLGSPGRLEAALGAGAATTAAARMAGVDDPTTAAIIGVGGAAAGIGLHQAAARLMTSPWGRTFLLNVIRQGGGHISNRTAGMISAAAAGVLTRGEPDNAPPREAR